MYPEIVIIYANAEILPQWVQPEIKAPTSKALEPRVQITQNPEQKRFCFSVAAPGFIRGRSASALRKSVPLPMRFSAGPQNTSDEGTVWPVRAK